MRLKNAFVAQFLIVLIQTIIFLLPLSIEFYKINLLLLFAYTMGSTFYMRVPFYHPYILFLCTFFLFMLSRVLLDVLGGENFAVDNSYSMQTFSLDVQIQLLLVLSIALIAIHFGAIFAFANTQKYQNDIPDKQHHSKLIKRVALCLFYVSLVPYLLRTLSIVYFIGEYGYMTEEIIKVDRIITNPILGISDDIFMMGFYLFLATFPSWKELRTPGLIYVILLLLSLGTGARGPVFTQLFVLIVYFGIRGQISKKVFIIAMASMIVLSQIAFLFRVGATPSVQSVGYYANTFFHNQGVSMMVVGLSIQEKEHLKEVSILSPLLHITRHSIGARLVGYRPLQAHTEEYPSYSRGLGDVLTYRVNRTIYLEGGGMGSALVAEFYLWARYFGVFIGCLLFVYFIIYWFERYKYTISGLFLLFYVLPRLFFSPRDSPLMVFYDAIRPALFLLLLYLFIQYYQKLKKQSVTKV